MLPYGGSTGKCYFAVPAGVPRVSYVRVILVHGKGLKGINQGGQLSKIHFLKNGELTLVLLILSNVCVFIFSCSNGLAEQRRFLAAASVWLGLLLFKFQAGIPFNDCLKLTEIHSERDSSSHGFTFIFLI